jgi:hypothetical protein
VSTRTQAELTHIVASQVSFNLSRAARLAESAKSECGGVPQEGDALKTSSHAHQLFG